jgi:hypothetical protein
MNYHGYGGYYPKGVEIAGYSGIFRKIQPVYYQNSVNKYKGQVLPSNVYGVISLYPKRPQRYEYSKELPGNYPLDLFFKTYRDELIKDLLDTPTRVSMVFWGEIKRRAGNVHYDLPEFKWEIESLSYEVDRTAGKYSFKQGIVLCSDFKELEGA